MSRSTAAFFCLLALLLGSGCGEDAPAPEAWKPSLIGHWTLDQAASLAASKANTGGEATPERREQAVASFTRELEQADTLTVEFRDDGRMTLTFDTGDGKPKYDNKTYAVESIEGKRVTLKVGPRTDVIDFDSADRMRGTSARGLLVQYWDRTK